MIEVENLTKYYGASPAIRDVTFNVEQGEILGFLGPNGAGKTTTMRIITGYLPPTSGTVKVAGFDVAEKSLEARSHIGYLPETVPLYTDLTTYEYLDFRGRICGLHNGRDRKTRIYDVMDELNIGDVSNKLIGKLSRGYRQRVGLAQALLHNPDTLILDEPTVGLDPVQITDVRNMIKELGRNHTIILSTHLLPEVSMVCNRVIIINRGRLVALDTPINLAEGVAESHEVVVEVGGKPSNVLQTLRGVPGVVSASLDGTTVASGGDAALPTGVYAYRVAGRPGSDLRAEIASATVGAGLQLLELRGVRLSLEDVFLRVIAREGEAEDEELDEDYDQPYDDRTELYDDQVDEYAEEDEEEQEAVVPSRSVRVKAKRVRR
jgi:ABC-2 type transport system ATP-binding protein